MRIRKLIEGLGDVPFSPQDDLVKRWNSSSQEEKPSLVKEIIDTYGKPSLNNIIGAITENFNSLGINPQKNAFMSFIDRLKFNPVAANNKQFSLLNQLYLQGKINLENDYLTRPSTYEDTNIKNFQFIVTIFDAVNDPNKLSQYFKNIDVVSEEELYIDNKIGGKIKPIGNKSDSPTDETIMGVTKKWNGNEGENQASTTDKKSGKGMQGDGYSVLAALQNQNFSITNLWSPITKMFKESFKKASIKYKPKNSLETYLNLITRLFPVSGKSKSSSELQEIKANAYRDINELKKIPHKDGDVVFVNYKNFQGGQNIEADMDPNNQLNTFLIKQGDRWLPYDAKDTSLSKYQKYLLNSNTVDNSNSQIDIVAGMIKVLDSDFFKPLIKDLGYANTN